ncbi:quinoprotein dehydrogenase-associated SoxYZ-like carrier [Faunimonas sp. B44]|uniref:quinoprotein dehydrogenase-associated SoxYZ-like carrier n=1 Tax=Faunimonas sp. B44 TaxID=3461493 RepID=UPI004043B638
MSIKTSFIALGLTLALAAAASAQPAPRQDPWPGLVVDVFDGRPIETGTGLVRLEAPARAEDAAVVPMTIRAEATAPDGTPIRRITLVIDENPAPVAAVFELGAEAGVTQIATRVRVNTYSNVHAVAEDEKGRLYMDAAFVKASGGCSAPALKDADQALASMGEMRFRMFEPAAQNLSTGAQDAQVMVRHPNYSGLQMDQVTRHYIPAHFIQSLVVKQGDAPILAVEGGISLSEDPNVRFTYRSNGEDITVEATDTEGKVFRSSWPQEMRRAS